MIRPWLLVLLFTAVTLSLSAQTPTPGERYALPRRVLPLEKALIKLTEAGAPLSYRPDQLPQLAVRLPGGRRTLERWLQLLLRDTELSFERGAAGYLILPDPQLQGRTIHLYGSVIDASTGERLIGATVQLPEQGIGTHANEYGFYSLPAPAGRQALRVTYVGYIPWQQSLVLRQDSLLEVRLTPNRELPQVIVTAGEGISEAANYYNTGTRIGRAEVAQLGGPGGEDDPLQLARLLPGVTSGSDGVGGVFIRGSEAGHNLILLDGVPVYGLSHAGGLFSIFSNQAIRRIDLYKDALPARFGGRIGGVLDVHTRDGNLYENEFTVGTSLLATQLAAEGPIQEGESSFLLTGRYFWAGDLLRRFSQQYKARRGREGFTDYRVHDVNFKLNQRAGKRGRFYLSVYSGVDDYANSSRQRDSLPPVAVDNTVFNYTTPSARSERVQWGTTVAALRYNHVFSDRTFGNFRLSYSDLATESAFERYDSLVERRGRDNKGEVFSGHYRSEIRQVGLAFDGQTTTDGNALLRYGTEVGLHRFNPQLRNGEALLETFAAEGAKYARAPHRPVQLTAYGSYEGRHRQLYYRLGLRGSAWWNAAARYYRLSPRLLLAGPLWARTDWQFSYDHSVQPIHLLNSFVIGMPSDLWVPATDRISPASAQQVSAALKQRIRNDLRLEGGVYYRRLRNLVAYPEGPQSMPDWWENLSTGRGRAYGLETSLQQSRGKVRGWLSYTLAFTDRQFDERINQGRRFPFRYDRRHSFNVLLIYQLGARTTLTGSWRYESGVAYSLSDVAIDNFDDPDGEPVYLAGERNSYRLRANHRLDLNLHTVLSSKDARLTHAIDVGLYNAYDRHNPIYYDTRPSYEIEQGRLVSELEYFQVYIAPLLPALSYQLTFGSGTRPVFGR